MMALGLRCWNCGEHMADCGTCPKCGREVVTPELSGQAAQGERGSDRDMFEQMDPTIIFVSGYPVTSYYF